MMTYLLLANLYLLVFYGFYYLFLRKGTFFQWNRVYLLFTSILAFTLPLVEFQAADTTTFYHYQLPTVYLGALQPMQEQAVAETLPVVARTWSPILYGYLIGCIIMALVVLVNLFRTISRLRQRQVGEAYSFFGVIRVDPALSDMQAVLQHERVHARQGHTADLLWMQLLKIFNWFNPVVYLFERSLRLQHEYIADGKSAADNQLGYAQLLVARAMGTESAMLSHTFSSKHTLKRRVAMLIRERSPKWSLLRYIMMIPIIGVMVLYAAANNYQEISEVGKTVAKTSAVTQRIYLAEPPVPQPAEQRSEQQKGDPVPQQRRSIVIQDTTAKPKKKEELGDANDDDLVFQSVEIDPQPQGGMAAFMKWVGANYEFPQEAIEVGVNGQVQVSFIVEKDGSLSDIKLIRDLKYGTGEAAVRLLKKSPKWSPGIQNGRNVRVAYTLPIRLNIQQ